MLKNYIVTSKYIKFKPFENLSKDFVHCYTKGYDDNQNEISYAVNRDNKADIKKCENNFYTLSRDLDFDIDKLVAVRQMHTDKVKIVSEDMGKFYLHRDLPVYDAMITDVKGITLVTKHADCVPVYFIDPVLKVIGLAHSGWKGTLNLIAKKTAFKMVEKFNCRLYNIVCVIGPSICQSCYEIQEDVFALFKEKIPFSLNHIEKQSSGYYLDLKNIIKSSLERIGILNINICNLCTSCNKHMLHSHRGSKGKCGRSLAVLGIR